MIMNGLAKSNGWCSNPAVDTIQGKANLAIQKITLTINFASGVADTLYRVRRDNGVVEMMNLTHVSGNTYTLNDTLEGGKADFSGINGYEPSHNEAFYISSVLHKAFVEVNEEGTEAAAATEGFTSLLSSSGKIPIFRADHPFLFAIRDRRSATILFLGRVADPTHGL